MADLLFMHGPIDRVAARVMRPGISFDECLPSHCVHWREAPKTKAFLPDYGGTAIDLTARSFGLFTVIGYLGRVGKKSSSGRRAAMWLCRCACGDYESRTAKVVKSANSSGDRCAVCFMNEFRRSGETDVRAFFRAKRDGQR